MSEHLITCNYSQLYEACFQFMNREEMERIWGSGLTVKIDETLLSRRNHHKGHFIPEIWAFGGI